MQFAAFSANPEVFLSGATDFAVKTASKIDFSKSSTWGVLGGGAFAVAVLYSRQGFDMMEQICNRTYIYNICWEDPAVDRQILNITSDDVIFRICSAGDIVLDYAIEGPKKIVICDMNEHQLYLFELKIRMLRDPELTFDEWWAIWGSSDVTVALKVWRRMRHTMSGGGRVWWDGRIERVFRKGFAKSGSTGFAVKWFLPWLMWMVGFNVKEWQESNFSHEYIKKNEIVIQKSAQWFRHIFPTILAPFAGVPKNQIGPEFQTVEFYEDILREIFLDPEFANHNYFYRFYYEGGYKSMRCCPRTLKAEHFDALRANADKFEWHHATVQETMERVQPHSFTKLVLLDHMDWMPNKIVHDEWIALQRATKPGAQVLWRSAFTTTDDKAFFNNIDIKDLSPEWYKKDRVKTYPGTFVAHMPKDPLPWIDEEMSPCQKASSFRKLLTTAKMILHPLTAGKINAHGDKMSAFYAAQAKGYDAVRENMLVGRPEMMSAFGPVREGHTWLDVGGGTGRNVHYIAAQLARFERIVVLDICPELLAIGEENARKTFTPSQCDRIHWVCLDINAPDVKEQLSKHLGNDLERGFDTITFSYSLSMIPKWEEALISAKSLLSPFGRVLVADFDTYSEAGNGIKDFLIRSWYAQDGVRIEAKSRHVIAKVFSDADFKVTFARFEKKLLGFKIPHYVACCRLQTITSPRGFRSSQSLLNLSKTAEWDEKNKMTEEKKME